MTLDEIFLLVLESEGGFSNHVKDNGGPTKYGVTLTQWKLWKKSQKETIEQLRKISKEQAKAVYLDFYWNPLNCNQLPRGVAYQVFDAGLLHGINKSARWLQLAVGAKVDGRVGPQTIAAVIDADDATTIVKIHDFRMKRVKGHEDYPTFGRGWVNRLLRVKKKALQYAR